MRVLWPRISPYYATEAARIEKERQEKEKADAEAKRIEKERQEKEKAAAEAARIEKQRQEKEKADAEAARIEKQRQDLGCLSACGAKQVNIEGIEFTIGSDVKYKSNDDECLSECKVPVGRGRKYKCGKDFTKVSVSALKDRKLCCVLVKCKTT